MNQIRNIAKLNQRELEANIPISASWHQEYSDTAYVFFGGVSYDLTEGDILIIFSQYGIPVHLKLVRDKETGKSKGFGWLKYEDQRSTILAVDNLNGAKVLGRVLRVDHAYYEEKERDEEYEAMLEEELKNDFADTEAQEKDIQTSNHDDEGDDEFKDPLLLMQKSKEKEHKSRNHRHHRHRDEDRERKHRYREKEREVKDEDKTYRDREAHKSRIAKPDT